MPRSSTVAGPIHYLDATTLAALIRKKELSPREVVRAHLDRIGSVNPKINAIVTLMADDADVAGFTAFLTRYRKALPLETTATEVL